MRAMAEYMRLEKKTPKRFQYHVEGIESILMLLTTNDISKRDIVLSTSYRIAMTWWHSIRADRLNELYSTIEMMRQ